jgi:flagellar protein FlaH
MVTQAPGKPKLVLTGTSEIDKKIGGGIPSGSLTLVDGQSDAGKSVVAQQFIWGAINHGLKVAVYTTENTTQSLIRQMQSLGWDVTDFFLLKRLNIYPVPNTFAESGDKSTVFSILLDHIQSLEEFDLIIVDSLTAFVSHASEQETLDFFSRAKLVCDRHRTLMLTMHSYAVNEQLLIRIRSICDSHLRLRVEEIGDQLMKVLEVAKIRGAAKSTGNIVSFDVQPNMGIRVVPVTKAKA